MRRIFNNSLQELQNSLLSMGQLVDTALERAVYALQTQDSRLAQQVIDADEEIDEAQMRIEDRCLTLIALQQPMAKDLRTLSTALKITIDLERMGDHAKNISEVTLEIGKQPLVRPLDDIPKMSGKVREMLQNALHSYVEMDALGAESVLKMDDEVDDLCELVLHGLLGDMLFSPSTVGQASQFLYIARCLERSGDHAKNIAEGVIFLVTGQRAK
jgi:phosphate transport system protein